VVVLLEPQSFLPGGAVHEWAEETGSLAGPEAQTNEAADKVQEFIEALVAKAADRPACRTSVVQPRPDQSVGDRPQAGEGGLPAPASGSAGACRLSENTFSVKANRRKTG
jgi:hypothetical protein